MKEFVQNDNQGQIGLFYRRQEIGEYVHRAMGQSKVDEKIRSEIKSCVSGLSLFPGMQKIHEKHDPILSDF